MDKAFIKNSHLYLQYSYFDVSMGCRRDREEIIPLDRISHLEFMIGPRGGDHGWTIYSKEMMEDGSHKELARFPWSGHGELLKQVRKCMKQLKIPVQESRD